MKKIALVFTAFLAFSSISNSSSAQKNYTSTQYPHALQLQNKKTPLKGFITSVNDSSFAFLELSSFKPKYSYKEFNTLKDKEIQVPYTNISNIIVEKDKYISGDRVFARALIGAFIGIGIGGIAGGFFVPESFESLFSPFEASLSLGILGLLIGMPIGLSIGLDSKEKDFQKLEFPLDPNSIESQREIVSKLIYKE